MELQNPWENLPSEFSNDNINEPRDFFNNIKLSDFPFLKSQFSSIEYLIKCKICNVMILPESVLCHYECRHSNGSNSDPCSPAALLPYEAVSWCEDKAENGTKKERPVKRAKVVALKRSKRLNTVRSSELMSCQEKSAVIIQPSVSSSSNLSRNQEISEQLREPVLLKLAKSEGKVTSHEDSIRLRDETKLNDRSVWSVVYSKEQPRVDGFGNLMKKFPSTKRNLSKDNIPDSSSGCTLSNDSGIGSQSLSAHRPSSYPPTPSLSPHLPSPSLSNASDDVTLISLGHFRNEHPIRPISRSSAHSSSSSGISGVAENHSGSETSYSNPYSLSTPGMFSSEIANVHYPEGIDRPVHKVKKITCKSSIRRVNKSASSVTPSLQSLSPLEVHPETTFDKEIRSAVYHLENDNIDSSGDIVSRASNKCLPNRNGYHNWVGDIRLVSPSVTRRGDDMKRFLTLQRIPGSSNSQRIAFRGQMTHLLTKPVQGATLNYSLSAHNCPISETIDTSDSIHSSSSSFMQSSIPPLSISNFKDRKARSENSLAPPWSHESMVCLTNNSPASVNIADGGIEDEDLDDRFDPMTQCGCVEMDDIKCRNSILCTVHTIEEKRRVNRQGDLRHLMREARQRQQVSRQVAGVPVSRQIPWIVQGSHSQNAVIDLTDDNAVDETFIGLSDTMNFSSATNRPDRHQILRSTAAYSHDSLGRNLLEHNAVEGIEEVDIRYIPNKIPNHLQQRESPHFIESVYPMDLNAQTNSLLQCTSEFINSQDLDSNSVHFDQYIPAELFLDESEISHISRSTAKQVAVFPSTSYQHSKLSADQMQTSHMHSRRLYQSSQSQAWANRLPKFPYNSNSRPISLDKLIAEETLCQDELGHPIDTSIESVQARKIRVPGNGQLVSGVSNPSIFHPQISYSSRNIPECSLTQSVDSSEASDSPARFIRGPPVFTTSQVVREPQGRVIVDDMREKSITGRSRKTARTSFRSSGSSFQGPNYSGLMHLRYQQHQKNQSSQIQTTPTFLTSRKSNSSSTLQSGSTILNRSISSSPNELISFTNTVPPVDLLDSTGSSSCINPHVFYRPSGITSNESSAYIDLTCSSSVNSSVDSGSKIISKFPSQLINYCIDNSVEQSYVSGNLQVRPNPSLSSSTTSPSIASIVPTFSIHSNMRTSNYPLQSQYNQPYHRTYFAQSLGGTQLTANEITPVLPSNRYLVIRPSAIRQSSNLIVRTRHGDTSFTVNRDSPEPN